MRPTAVVVAGTIQTRWFAGVRLEPQPAAGKGDSGGASGSSARLAGWRIRSRERMKAIWAIPTSNPDGGAGTLAEVRQMREEWDEHQQQLENLQGRNDT
jgi:hypothetical protein